VKTPTKLKYVFVALLALTLATATPALRAQSQPASEQTAASPSTASGQRSEPQAQDVSSKKEVQSDEDTFRKSPSVIKFGAMLGMNPETASTVFEWFNALVLFAAVGYGLAKMLPKAFRARTEGIQKNIVEARVATEEAQARLAAVEARLGKLDGEISSLRAENDKAAAEEEARIHATIEEEKQRILQSAEQEIAAASAAAQRDLRAYAAGIAIDRAAAQLNITPEDDRALIANFAGKLTEGSRN
jgi:F-type H+-transporting ATPase subunit b